MGALDRLAIAAALHELGGYLRLVEREPYRARAYEAGAAALEALSDQRFAALLGAGQLTEVPGIGKGLAASIAELAARGTTDTLERLRRTLPPALLALTDVPGLTAARLRRIHDGLGVVDAEGLKAALDSGAVATLKGFGGKTVETIREGLARHAGRPRRFLLADALELGGALEAHLRGLPGVRAVTLAGEARRSCETVGALHLLAAAADPGPVLDGFAAWPRVAGPAERTGHRAEAVLSNGVPVTVEVVPAEAFGLALVLATGAPAHVGALAARAQARGLALEALVAPTEAEVYARLDLPVVPPELREDEAELARAAGGDDFSDLVTEADIRGAVHCHTTFSDGRNTVAEMAAAAAARGLSYITITDHSPTASYAGGVPVDRLPEQWAEIDRVAADAPIALLRGTESDIRGDGGLDYPADVLGRLDVVIASIHDRQRMTPAQMTERLVAAMRAPVFKIWGHALGRLLLRRDPIDCDVAAVLDAAAAGRAAIEINGDPNRLDLPPRWIREARRRGLRFVISTDAHATRELDHLRFGVLMARRGGVRRREVLNALPEEGFRAAVLPAAGG
jgi:DNA polymerase (family 10)